MSTHLTQPHQLNCHRDRGTTRDASSTGDADAEEVRRLCDVIVL